MENSKLSFILASSSPRRKELIGHLQIPFEVKSIGVSEESSSLDPAEFCREIAFIKGRAVFDHLLLDQARDSLYVVSADTIVSLDRKIFGKPSNKTQAREFLWELSGKTHSVFTSVVVHFGHNKKKDTFSFVEESKVTFDNISHPILERYLMTGDSLDKAGAYGIQGPSLTFISKIEGDYANVVGFPLSKFVTQSEHFLRAKFPHEDIWLNLF